MSTTSRSDPGYRRRVAVGLLLTSVAVAAVAQAAIQFKGPSGLGVNIERDRIMGTSGAISAAGNKLRADVDVQFECPSGALTYVHASNTNTRKQWFDDYAKAPKTFTFKSVTLATTEDLQQACIDGKSQYLAELNTEMNCKGLVSSDWHAKTVKVPIKLSCKNVISPSERVARVSVRDWKHTCPAGYVFKSTMKSTPLVSASNARQPCVRP